MNFKTFLEDFAWFQKDKRVGSSYLHPIKRDSQWLKVDKLTSVDKMHFEDLIEDHDDVDELKEQVDLYKRNYTQSPKLIEFVKGCKLNRDYVVYRNFSSKVDVSKLTTGGVIPSLPGKLTPTSLNYKTATGFTRNRNRIQLDGKIHRWTARIVVKKGSPGFYTDLIESQYDDEQEILLWTPRLKVTGFSYVVIGPTVVHTVDCVV